MTRNRTYDPKNDLIFKYLCTRENEFSHKLLKVLIEGALSIKVNSLTVVNPNISRENVDERDLILDVKVKDELNNVYDIEMQCYGPSEEFRRRFSQYGHKLAGDLYEKGEIYNIARKIYQILFVDEKNDQTDKLIETYQMKNEDGKVLSEDLLVSVYVYIQNIEEYVDNDLFKEIVYYFNHPEERDILMTRNEMIAMMVDNVNKFNEDEELADLAYKRRLAQYSRMYGEKITREKAMAEGKAKGRIEGRAEGLTEGQRKVNQLNQLLLKDKRYEDLEKASNDEVYQAQLFKEFGL